MSRYYTPVSAQPETPFWKSPAILGAMPKRFGEDAYALAIGVSTVSIAMEFTTQSAIHIRADDNSESAAGEALQRQVHCQASSHNYKPGDTVISIAFADRPVVSQKLTIFNSLSLLGKCQKSDREIKNKRPGTSLILLLERIRGIIQEQRAQNNLNPAVATMMIRGMSPEIVGAVSAEKLSHPQITMMNPLPQAIACGGGFRATYILHAGENRHSVIPKRHSVALKNHSVIPKRHSVALKNHSVIPKRHSVIPKRHSVIPKRHSVALKNHSVIPKRHSVIPKRHSVALKNHSVIPKRHSVAPKAEINGKLNYGIAANTKQDLPCSSFEGEPIATLYQIPHERHLRGRKATVAEYRQLIKQVQGILSSHHAKSRLDNPLESVLVLGDGNITLGELLTPGWRLPDLGDVFLSCCETRMGLTADLTDDILTIAFGFLCAGARSVVSTL